MTLARYTGPLKAFVGAIGEAAPGGVMVGGRMRKGRDVAPLYQLHRDDTCEGAWSTWEAAAIDLASRMLERGEDAASADVLASVPAPGGLEVTCAGCTWRLIVV